jgi:hypothetical protein
MILGRADWSACGYRDRLAEISVGRCMVSATWRVVSGNKYGDTTGYEQ